MKKIFTLLIIIIALPTAVGFGQINENNLTEGSTLDSWLDSKVFVAQEVDTPPVIDGDPVDDAWNEVEWQKCQYILGSPATYEGNADLATEFKIVWDQSTYYLLLKIVDDILIHTDDHRGYYNNADPKDVILPDGISENGEFRHWNMDCIEFYITTNGIQDVVFWNGNQTRHDDQENNTHTSSI